MREERHEYEEDRDTSAHSEAGWKDDEPTTDEAEAEFETATSLTSGIEESLEIEVELEAEGPRFTERTDSLSADGTVDGMEEGATGETGERELGLESLTSRFDPITAAVHQILVNRLNPRDPIGSRKLKEMGGTDPFVRAIIVRDLNTTWPNLRRAIQERDISGEDTLASISLLVRRRM